MSKADKARKVIEALNNLLTEELSEYTGNRVRSLAVYLQENVVLSDEFSESKKKLEVGKRFEISGARVLSIKEDYYSYGYSQSSPYRKVTVIDPTYGKVWFSSGAAPIMGLEKGDFISASLMLTKNEEEIIFSKKPTRVRTFTDEGGAIFESAQTKKVKKKIETTKFAKETLDCYYTAPNQLG